MRRILLMLPVLALMACQPETPTAIDEPILRKVSGGERRVILDDASVNEQDDMLQFYVENPGHDMPPCWVSPKSWWQVEARDKEPRNAPPTYFGIAFEYLTESQCSDGPSWTDYTDDDIPDFTFSVDGYYVCTALNDYSVTHIRVSGELASPADGAVVNFEETFVIRCPILK